MLNPYIFAGSQLSVCRPLGQLVCLWQDVVLEMFRAGGFLSNGDTVGGKTHFTTRLWAPPVKSYSPLLYRGGDRERDIWKPGHAEPKLSAWIDTVFGWRGCERTVWVDCRLMGVGLERVSMTLRQWDATLCTSVGDAQVQFVSTYVLVHPQCVWIMWVCDCKANIMTDWHRGLNWIIKQHDWLITSLN